MSKNRNCKNYLKIPVEIIDHRYPNDQHDKEAFLLTEQTDLAPDELRELFYPVKKFFLKKRKASVTFVFENNSWVFHIDSRTPKDFNIEKMLRVIEDVLLVYCNIQSRSERPIDVYQFREHVKPYIQLFYGKKLDGMPDWLLKEPLGQTIQELYPKLRDLHRVNKLSSIND